ncbi:MAG: hypothetical protein Q8O22_02645 [Candidatus Omnitrophota bacterium]|nr:hypothetical protein [Candidatus Omnitrophota bacterium]
MMRIVIILTALLVLAPFLFRGEALAGEVVILYTGQTHAMLYPCSCPKESDGGIARRVGLIRQLKKKYPNALLLDAGEFFAGGVMDEYSQNAELDKRRSLLNLAAMGLAGYDAVAISADEFNFGGDFLRKNIASTKINFLSSNLAMEGFRPYLIKDVGSIKVGITAVTSLAAAQKAGALAIAEPKKAVAEAVAALKNSGADIIVLMSGLGADADKDLLKSVSGIDIVISGGLSGKEEVSSKIGDTLYFQPSWQGRKLSKLVLSVENKSVIKSAVEEIRLSDKVPDDQGTLAILPRCFSDANCKKDAQVGTCLEPGQKSAQCSFKAANKISLTVITARDCRVCDTAVMTGLFKRDFPGLAVNYMYYPEAKAKNMLKDFSITALPAYLFGKEIEKENKFDVLKNFLIAKGAYYIVKKEFSGFSYLPEKKKIPGRLDLFISLFDKNTPAILETVKDFSPGIHFLAAAQGLGFTAPAGNLEVEEHLRAVCVRSLYPERFWDYITCRAGNPHTSWWEDCASGMDTDAVSSCARSDKAKALLTADTALNRELSVMNGPTYLIDNQEIFTTNGLLKKDALKKLMKR